MTPKQAKELLPVIHAFAEGKAVQFFSEERGAWLTDPNPSFHLSRKWRVKPEKVVRWVNVYPGVQVWLEGVWNTKEDADRNSISNRIACIRIEFEEGEGL